MGEIARSASVTAKTMPYTFADHRSKSSDNLRENLQENGANQTDNSSVPFV